jgi:hypothetical protein
VRVSTASPLRTFRDGEDDTFAHSNRGGFT